MERVESEFDPYLQELPGHLHIFSGESLTNSEVNPTCVRIDAETEGDLYAGNRVAWAALIACLVKWNE